MYVICWKNKLTGIEGHSEFVYPKPIAQDIADDLNKQMGNIANHWIEDEDNQEDGYFYEPKQETPRTAGNTQTQKTDSAG